MRIRIQEMVASTVYSKTPTPALGSTAQVLIPTYVRNGVEMAHLTHWGVILKNVTTQTTITVTDAAVHAFWKTLILVKGLTVQPRTLIHAPIDAAIRL